MGVAIPVFVGSTFTDLQEYRTAARDALHRLEAVVRGMEYFGSLPDTPKEECLRVVRSCRVYVGIYGMRYGSIDAATGKSLTHLEYDEAQRVGLPSLIYLLDSECSRRSQIIQLARSLALGVSSTKTSCVRQALALCPTKPSESRVRMFARVQTIAASLDLPEQMLQQSALRQHVVAEGGL